MKKKYVLMSFLLVGLMLFGCKTEQKVSQEDVESYIKQIDSAKVNLELANQEISYNKDYYYNDTVSYLLNAGYDVTSGLTSEIINTKAIDGMTDYYFTTYLDEASSTLSDLEDMKTQLQSSDLTYDDSLILFNDIGNKLTIANAKINQAVSNCSYYQESLDDYLCHLAFDWNEQWNYPFIIWKNGGMSDEEFFAAQDDYYDYTKYLKDFNDVNGIDGKVIEPDYDEQNIEDNAVYVTKAFQYEGYTIKEGWYIGDPISEQYQKKYGGEYFIFPHKTKVDIIGIPVPYGYCYYFEKGVKAEVNLSSSDDSDNEIVKWVKENESYAIDNAKQFYGDDINSWSYSVKAAAYYASNSSYMGATTDIGSEIVTVKLYPGAKFSFEIGSEDAIKTINEETNISINGYNIVACDDGSFSIEFYDQDLKQLLYTQLVDGVVEITR